MVESARGWTRPRPCVTNSRMMKSFRWVVLAAGLFTLADMNLLPATAADKAAPTDAIKHVDPAAGEKLLAANKDVIVLDVRTPGEFTGGHLPKARNVDFNADDFEKKLGELDRTKTYLVHCASGGRSGRSLELFQKLEFKSVYHLDGGYSAWQRAGKAVEK